MNLDITILREGEVVDTYGGDYTYEDTGYTDDNGSIQFYYRQYSSTSDTGWELVDDTEHQQLMVDYFPESL